MNLCEFVSVVGIQVSTSIEWEKCMGRCALTKRVDVDGWGFHIHFERHKSYGRRSSHYVNEKQDKLISELKLYQFTER